MELWYNSYKITVFANAGIEYLRRVLERARLMVP
jgi:hypothetical protein